MAETNYTIRISAKTDQAQSDINKLQQQLVRLSGVQISDKLIRKLHSSFILAGGSVDKLTKDIGTANRLLQSGFSTQQIEALRQKAISTGQLFDKLAAKAQIKATTPATTASATATTSASNLAIGSAIGSTLGVSGTAAAVKELSNYMKNLRFNTELVDEALKDLTPKLMELLGTNAEELAELQNKLQKELKQTTELTKKLGKLTQNIGLTGKKSFMGIDTQLIKTLSKLYLLKKGFDLVKAAIVNSVKSAALFLSLQARLTNLYGSALKAKQVFTEFKQVAVNTPFSLNGVVQAGAQLKAFGVDALKMIIPISDLAAYMGIDVVLAASAMGRAFAGGVGAADILRERGVLQLVKLFTKIDDLTKLTLPQFRLALESALIDPAAGIAGSSKRMMDTYNGALSNLKDSAEVLKSAVGTSLLPLLKNSFGLISSSFNAMARDITLKNVRRLAEDTNILFWALTLSLLLLRKKTQLTTIENDLLSGTIEKLQSKYSPYLKNIDLAKTKYNDLAISIGKARALMLKQMQATILQGVILKNKGDLVDVFDKLAKANIDKNKSIAAYQEAMQKAAPGSTAMKALQLGLKGSIAGYDYSIGVYTKRVEKGMLVIREIQGQLEQLSASPMVNTTGKLTKQLGASPTNSKELSDLANIAKIKELIRTKNFTAEQKLLDDLRIKFDAETDLFIKHNQNITDLSENYLEDKAKIRTKYNKLLLTDMEAQYLLLRVAQGEVEGYLMTSKLKQLDDLLQWYLKTKAIYVALGQDLAPLIEAVDKAMSAVLGKDKIELTSTLMQDMATSISQSVGTMASSFGTAFAQMAFDGSNFGKSMKNMLKQLAIDITSTIMKLLVLRGIMALLGFINPTAGTFFGTATGLVTGGKSLGTNSYGMNNISGNTGTFNSLSYKLDNIVLAINNFTPVQTQVIDLPTLGRTNKIAAMQLQSVGI